MDGPTKDVLGTQGHWKVEPPVLPPEGRRWSDNLALRASAVTHHGLCEAKSFLWASVDSASKLSCRDPACDHSPGPECTSSQPRGEAVTQLGIVPAGPGD